MTYEQFEATVSRYGGDLDAWPAAARAEAQALVATDPAAARLLAEAGRLDAALAALARPRPLDAAFVGGVLAGIRENRHRDVMVRPTRRLAAWSGVAMAAFLAIGFAIGLAMPRSDGDDALAGLMFGASGLTAVDGAGDLL
jgi:hypothetical protein